MSQLLTNDCNTVFGYAHVYSVYRIDVCVNMIESVLRLIQQIELTISELKQIFPTPS